MIKLTLNSTLKLKKLYILIGETWLKRTTKSSISHPFAIASALLAFFFYVSLLSIIFIISDVNKGIFYCLNYTSLLIHLITTHLVSHLSLSSIIFSISVLIIDIFYCLNCILLLLHLIITYLVNIFYNNYVINIFPPQLLWFIWVSLIL